MWLDDLRSAGLAPDDAFAIFQALMAYAHGLALMEISHVGLEKEDVDVARFPGSTSSPRTSPVVTSTRSSSAASISLSPACTAAFREQPAAQRRSRCVKRVST